MTQSSIQPKNLSVCIRFARRSQSYSNNEIMIIKSLCKCKRKMQQKPRRHSSRASSSFKKFKKLKISTHKILAHSSNEPKFKRTPQRRTKSAAPEPVKLPGSRRTITSLWIKLISESPMSPVWAPTCRQAIANWCKLQIMVGDRCSLWCSSFRERKKFD